MNTRTMNTISRAAGVTVGCFVMAQANAAVVAHWTFDNAADFASGVVNDVSGNGNTLFLQTLPGTDASEGASFVDLGNGQGAVRFNGKKSGINGGVAGQYFATAANAPINSMNFANGYTVEVSFQVPADWTAAENRWMGALARSGKPSGDAAAAMAISNLGEVQWQTQAISGRQQAVWSPAYFPAFTGWHQTAFVNEPNIEGGWNVTMFFDGLSQFRNIIGKDHQGLASYDAPWFVGLGLWNNQPDSPWYGLINDIRISDVPLAANYTAPVPLPGALWLLGSALVGVGARSRRRTA